MSPSIVLFWSLSPKENYNSPTETSFALNLAVCLFNSGIKYTVESLMKRANLNISNYSLKQLKLIDLERIQYSDYSVRIKTKLRRKQRKRSDIKRQDAFKHKEGTQYESGAFYNN